MATETTTPARRAASRGLWRLFEFAIALYGLLSIGYLLARLLVGERWRPVAFANNFVPWWTLGAAGALGVALLSPRRWWLIPLQIPLIIAFVVLYGDRFLPSVTTGAAHEGPELRIMTYNVQTRGTTPEELEATLRDLQPDIVGLEEFHRSHLEAATALEDLYPYQALHVTGHGAGLALLSRFPVLDYRAVNQSTKYPRSMRVELDVNGTPVTVYVVHPETPHDAYSPWGYDDSRRDAQLAEARASIATESGPVLMLCDCNMSDQSDAYRAFDALLDDSFREVGRGLGLTFPAHFLPTSPSPVPLLRLDYVWHSDDFTARAAQVERDKGTSDHHPVMAQLVLEPRSPTDE